MNKTIALQILSILKQQRQVLITLRATLVYMVDTEFFVPAKIRQTLLDSNKELTILQTQIEELESLITKLAE